MKKKKIPMRKELISGEMRPKRELIRIVRNKQGEVSVDPTGKKPGRGAYVAVDVDAVKKAQQNKIIEKTFGVQISDDFYQQLSDYAEHLQARQKLIENGQAK
mgnify:CR=1 FL=1